MAGLFITATDTGVGKTALSAALLAAIAASGRRALAHKPAVTGLDEPLDAGDPDTGNPASWPADHELLGAAADMAPAEVAPLRYGPAVSPALAAELAGEPIDDERLLARARAAATAARTRNATLVVEGVGGLLTPLSDELVVRDLAVALELPLLIAARTGLGTINQTLLTLAAARAAGLHVLAVVLTPWPARPSRLERSNRETIERLGDVAVHTLIHAAGPELAELARVGARLPWRDWVEAPIAA